MSLTFNVKIYIENRFTFKLKMYKKCKDKYNYVKSVQNEQQ